MNQVSLFSAAILILFSASGYECRCVLNTANWCSSIEMAKECNVVDQCQKYVWPFVMMNSADTVNLTLYYETLCPDCRDFISNQVFNAFISVSSIMNLTLIPYGNSKETYRQETKLWQFTCQHGPDECWGNLLHSCLIYYYPDVSTHFPFVHCMESNNNGSIEDIAFLCATKFNIPLNNIFDNCVYNVKGNQLQHNYATLTESLNPPHQYVPWVTVNGVHTEDIQNKAQDDLVGLICSSYKGMNKPAACK